MTYADKQSGKNWSVQVKGASFRSFIRFVLFIVRERQTLRRFFMTVLEARMVDATHLELSEPVDLPPGRKLVVSVVAADEDFDERRQWSTVSEASLQTAYSDSEPDYSLDLIKKRNLEYER